MKKAAVSLIIIAVLLLSSCGRADSADMFIDASFAARFEDCIGINEALDDVRKIELTPSYDLNGLRAVKETDSDTGETLTKYYTGKGELKYTKREGYGDSIDCYMKSRSGRELTVNYSLDDNSSVTIDCDDYYVRFYGADESLPYRAEETTVRVKRPSDRILSETLECRYENGKCFDQEVFWFDDSGYHKYYAYIDDSGEKQTDEQLLFERLDSAPVTSGEMLCDGDITVMPQFIMGKHSLSYTGTKENPVWYLETDFVLTFGCDALKEDFARKYSLAKSEPRGNESDAPTLRTGERAVRIADECEGIGYLMITYEINDNYYLAVSLNDKGEIDSITPGFYSLY